MLSQIIGSCEKTVFLLTMSADLRCAIALNYWLLSKTVMLMTMSAGFRCAIALLLVPVQDTKTVTDCVSWFSYVFIFISLCIFIWFAVIKLCALFFFLTWFVLCLKYYFWLFFPRKE